MVGYQIWIKKYDKFDTNYLFKDWFEHCIILAHPTKLNNRISLILDGHSTHVKNIDVIDKARDVGVDILRYPPHTMHRLQPLDVS